MFKKTNLIYAGLFAAVMAVMLGSVIFAGLFLSKEINNALQLDEEKINANVTKVDLESYNKIAPSLGLSRAK